MAPRRFASVPDFAVKRGRPVQAPQGADAKREASSASSIRSTTSSNSTTREVALLGLPAVQRLRRLRQLGLAYMAYPSAEHSRFTPRARCTRDRERALRRAARATRPSLSRTTPTSPTQRRLVAREPAAARHRARSVQPRLRSRARRAARAPHRPRSLALPDIAPAIAAIGGRPRPTCSRSSPAVRRTIRSCASSSAARTSTPTAWTTSCATRISPASQAAATTPIS